MVGGGINSEAQGPTGDVEFADPDPADGPGPEYASVDFGDESIEPEAPVSVEGPFIDDGTLVKPIAVDTTVPDGADLVKTYKVKSGDTLAKIAESFQVSTMSVVWANDLKGKDDLKNGQTLSIPPVTGLIIQVAATDTLDSLATHYGVNRTDILATNGIDDPNLVVGQVLVIPGAKGQPIPQKPSKPITRPTTTAVRWRRHGPPALDVSRRVVPVAGHGRQQLHQPVLPLRPLRPGHRGRLRDARPRRGRRHGHLRRLEEQRRRLPGVGRPRLRPVHDLQPHVRRVGRTRRSTCRGASRSAGSASPATPPGRTSTSRSGAAQSGTADGA